ncbi:hypothetical protein CMI37_09535 [Candidatus Pacearchaeota archaeon]|nr:hypothetical protein [Candidatus Pacearchaeota archaeon]
MSSQVSALLDNIVTRMEAITAQTALGGVSSFVHLPIGYDAESALEDLKKPTRRFVVGLTGGREDGPPLLNQIDTGPPLRQTFDVTVAYRQRRDSFGLAKAIAEDVDDIGHELQRTDGDRYDAATTGLWRRTTTGYEIEFDDAKGGVALLTIPVECDYEPTY